MPESPEVETLAEELGERLRGRTLAAVDILEFRVAKTRTRAPASLIGQTVTGVDRHGKLLDLSFGPQHFVVSLGRHGWARWGTQNAPDAAAASAAAAAPEATPAPPPALATLAFDDGPPLDLTDAGGWVSLGLWVVDEPAAVPAVAKLGPDPANPAFSRDDFDTAIAGRRKQVKAILQEQESLAGIGNAYSDEILHAARISPVAHAAMLTTAELDRLFDATTSVITTAIAARRGVPIAELKAAKVAAMQVHGRAGETCPVCGDTIRDFSFASTTAQYSPNCQTNGEILPLR